MQQGEDIIYITTNNTPGNVNSRIVIIIFTFIVKYESAIDWAKGYYTILILQDRYKLYSHMSLLESKCKATIDYIICNLIAFFLAPEFYWLFNSCL